MSEWSESREWTDDGFCSLDSHPLHHPHYLFHRHKWQWYLVLRPASSTTLRLSPLPGLEGCREFKGISLTWIDSGYITITWRVAGNPSRESFPESQTGNIRWNIFSHLFLNVLMVRMAWRNFEILFLLRVNLLKNYSKIILWAPAGFQVIFWSLEIQQWKRQCSYFYEA